MSSVAAAPEGAAPGAGPASRRRPALAGPHLDAVLALALAAGIVLLAFVTTGGLDVVAGAGDTWSEIAITVIGGSVVGAVVVLGARGRAWSGVTVALFAALALLTALSVLWSVAPDASWQSAAQTLSYLAAFAAAAALARIVPQRWRALIGAITVGAVALGGYALLAKAFPGVLDPGDETGRLQVPFGYWNAIGVAAALGFPGCLWAGTDPRSARPVRALSVPAMAILISVVVLSYSRSALLVLILAGAAWLIVVPLRIRSAALLALGAAGAAAIAGWALRTAALTHDRIPEAQRVSAGHSFAIVLGGAVLVLILAGGGFALGLERIRLAPGTRRRVGALLVGLVALAPVLGLVALAESSRGLTGEISHVWSTLTSTGGSGSAVGDNAGRLLEFGNSRPIYWRAGFDVGDHFPLAGAGAEAFGVAHLAHAAVTIPVGHVHSFAIETYADLGLLGVALTLALLISWGIAAARPLAPRTRWEALSEERAAERRGLIAIAIVAGAFGIQSAVDWTWYFTGITLPAIVCAGWLAGRGPLASPGGRAQPRSLLDRPGAVAAVMALSAVILAGGWATWQPLRSADAYSASLDAVAAHRGAQAFTDASTALDIDPVTIEPLPILSALDAGAGEVGAARRELVEGVERQPQNPQPWSWLAQFDLAHHRAGEAVAEMTRELRLDIHDNALRALRDATRRRLAAPGAP